ncbi:hypothetical protein Abr02nite_71560 [Paractinoplanes brasiliensis]|nr:hypothetical protein Abr02nite_71560 [Actinoplanes brasiliensis]
MTIAEAAKAAEVDKAQVSRLETATRLPVVNTVKALCHAYSLDSGTTERLVGLARAGRRRGWWEDYKLEPETKTFVSFESAASVIEDFENSVLPGLLQIEEYAIEAIRPVRSDFSPLRLSQLVDTRLTRQGILAGTSDKQATVLRAVIDEAVLLRRVGGPDIMRKQLDHLLMMSERNNVTLRVLPFEAGAHPAQDGPFTILNFSQEWMGNLVYVEGPLGQVLVDRAGVVDGCRENFDTLMSISANDQESRKIIRSARAGL